MSQSPDEKREVDRTVPSEGPGAPLGYAAGRDNPTGRRPLPRLRFAMQMLLGFVAYLAVPLGTVIIVLARGPDKPGAVTVVALLFVALVAVTIYVHVRWRWTGFVVGVLLGIGLTLLAVRLCFDAVTKVFFNK